MDVPFNYMRFWFYYCLQLILEELEGDLFPNLMDMEADFLI